jgi:hypothetical protein
MPAVIHSALYHDDARFHSLSTSVTGTDSDNWTVALAAAAQASRTICDRADQCDSDFEHKSFFFNLLQRTEHLHAASSSGFPPTSKHFAFSWLLI